MVVRYVTFEDETFIITEKIDAELEVNPTGVSRLA